MNVVLPSTPEAWGFSTLLLTTASGGIAWAARTWADRKVARETAELTAQANVHAELATAQERLIATAEAREAAANARGLHDPKENCSLPAHVVSLEGRAHSIPPEDAAGRGALSTDAATVLADLTSARPRAGVAALSAAERDDLVTRTRAVLTAIQK